MTDSFQIMTMPDSSVHKKLAKKPIDHPPYSEMIKSSILALKERTGSSRQAIERYITANYTVGEVSSHFKTALKRMVASGKLVQVKGVGASGSFKMAKAEKTPIQKKKVPQKKPATKPNKPSAKKTTIKKPPAKKVTKTSKQTPVKKPAAKKPAVKKQSPKTAAKKPTARKRTKKPAVKKASTRK